MESRVEGLVERVRCLPPLLADGVLALAVLVATLLVLDASRPVDAGPPLDATGVAVLLVGTGSLTLRRLAPLAVFLVTVASGVVAAVSSVPATIGGFTTLLALFTVANRCRVTVSAPAFAVTITYTLWAITTDLDRLSTVTAVSETVIIAAVWLWGVNRRRDRDTDLDAFQAVSGIGDRIRRVNPVLADGAFAALLLGLVLLSLFLAGGVSRDTLGQLDLLGWSLLILQFAPLAVRRVFPRTVLIVTGFATGLYFSFGYGPTVVTGIGVLVALYTVAALRERRDSLIALAWSLAGVTVSIGAIDGFPIDELLVNYLFFITGWALGDNARARRRLLEEAEDRASRLEDVHPDDLVDGIRVVAARESLLARP